MLISNSHYIQIGKNKIYPHLSHLHTYDDYTPTSDAFTKKIK